MDAETADLGTPQRACPTGNVLDWLLSCQHLKRHPFTGADPGGFGWSDLSGAVPDADDTPGALLALDAWRRSSVCGDAERKRIESAALKAIRWLLRLQNHDGGWPTFCRGWGRLPFDRSGTDLTAHVLRALRWWPLEPDRFALEPPGEAMDRLDDAAQRIWFLKAHQHQDGSWSPLWFGNQVHPQEDNPVYGTARVLMAYRDHELMDSPEAQRGVAWLVANQNEDGGWGSGMWGRGRRTKDEGRRTSPAAELKVEIGVESAAGEVGTTAIAMRSSQSTEYSVLSTPHAVATTPQPSMPSSPLPPPSPEPRVPSPAIPNLKFEIQNLKSSVEETALAIEALLAAIDDPAAAAAVEKGLAWLVERVERGEHRQPAPIGFYFAKLWYYETLYPLTFTVAALGRACRTYSRPSAAGTENQTQALRSP